MATVMMSIVLTCTYVGQIPFGDKILPIQRTCIYKPSLYCFFPSICADLCLTLLILDLILLTNAFVAKPWLAPSWFPRC